MWKGVRWLDGRKGGYVRRRKMRNGWLDRDETKVIVTCACQQCRAVRQSWECVLVWKV